MPAERLRGYELVMVISPEADEDGVAASVQEAADFVTGHGGSISEQQNWGTRRLAYPIQRFQEGYYVLVRFALDAAHAQELERTLQAAEPVLRHLITTLDRAPEPAAPEPAVPEPAVPEPAAPEPAVTEPAAVESAATETGD